jgi:hypothetical protein
MLATGDGFTAVFGAPVAQEDHARRAVLAAIELRQRLHDAPALHAQLAGEVLSLGMGLHSGLVVVGSLGQDPQQLATAVGAPFHVATRLQQQAAPGTTLLDLQVALECLARLNSEARQVCTFALLRHLLLDAAQRQPLVLVVENLHWSDPTSAAWLASLVERLAGAAVLLLGTYRPGSQPVRGAYAAVTQVAVPPLRAQDSRRCIALPPSATCSPMRSCSPS